MAEETRIPFSQRVTSLLLPMLEGRREGGDFPLENTEILGHCSWLDINY